jgi:HKD family nuclease
MKVEPFFNRGLATLESEFRDAVGSATHIDLASAFLTREGLRRLESILDSHDWPAVRILVGLYQSFTPPEVIARLLQLQRKHKGRFSARIAKNERFHWKYFCFRGSNAARAYVGSANLTTDGFTASGEVIVRLKGRPTDNAIRSLHDEFNATWTRHTRRITQELLRLYKSKYQPSKIRSIDKALAEFLEKPERNLLAIEPLSKPRLIFVSEMVSEETAKYIRQETDWHRRNWDYTVFPDKSSYSRACHAGVLLRVSAWPSDGKFLLEFCRVRDYLDSISTKDGKYFVAHAKVPRSWSRDCSKIKSELRKLRLTKNKLQSERYLNHKQIVGLARLLHADLAKLT